MFEVKSVFGKSKIMILRSNSKTLSLNHPVVMGILNVTPDSFSDGGRFNSVECALAQAEKMIAAGVSIIDIGGESTRPGASDVSLQQELDRTIPVIKAIRSQYDVWISIDTSKAAVMQQAIEAGADIVNDVRALQQPGALDMVVRYDVPVCLMHMQGQPETMQSSPQYRDLITEITDFLSERVTACEKAGVKRDNIILDPGFGFGKTLQHNYHLLGRLEDFHHFGLPILAGMSRKSMIFRLLEKEPSETVAGSVACATIAALKGAQIIRVHDFEETLDALKVVSALKVINALKTV